MGLLSGIMKCILYFINTLMLIGGLASIVFASYYFKSLPTLFASYLLFIGCFIFIIAMLGCCGICKENVAMTKTYAILILISFVLQLVGKFVLINVDSGKEYLTKGVTEQWAKEVDHPGSMDAVQILYKCCGRDSSADYVNILQREIPKTCYSNHDSHGVLYTRGCLIGADDFATSIYSNSQAGVWSNLVFTIIIFAFACYLVIRFTKKQQRYNYN